MNPDFAVIDVASGRRPSLRRFMPDIYHELSLRTHTAEEILKKAADYQGLLRRYGWRRVMAFYEEQLLPALQTLPMTEETWRVRFEVGCLAVATQAVYAPSRKVTEVAQTLLADLPRARFDQDSSKDRERRHWVRTNLAKYLAKAADWMWAHGQEADALYAYDVVDHLRPLNPTQRAAYANLLWHANDRRSAAIPVYLRYLGDCRWDTTTPYRHDMARFVLTQLTINEHTPQEEIPQRVLFNQVALCCANPPPVVLYHTGLGYLRLGQATRALDYLRRAQLQSGQDGGTTSFYLAQAMFQTGASREAAAAFEQAAEQGYSRARIASWLAVAYAKDGQLEKAWQSFQSAEGDYGDNLDSEFYLHWGRTSFRMHQTEDAARRFRQALARDKNSWRARHGLAICLERLGQRGEAIALLRQTVVEAGNFAPVYHFLGRLLQAEGEMDEALLCYRRAVECCPGEAEYALALGLALDDRDDTEGLTYLEWVAEAGGGGAEVIRRVALGYFRGGDKERARHWLQKLSTVASVATEVARFRARDFASQATVAFNAGRYREAVALWKQVAEVLPEEPQVRERLALILLCDATARLRSGDTGQVWEQIDQAHQLAASTESQFFYGVSRLVRGDFTAAQQQFAVLLACNPERAEYGFFEGLAAYFAGDMAAMEKLARFGASIENTDIQVLLDFLQIQFAALAGDFKQAAESLDLLVQKPQAVKGLGLPQSQLNVFAALCKIHGSGPRRQRVVRFFEELNAQYGENYWSLAVVLARHHDATARGTARAMDADVTKLTECETAYQALLDQTASEERLPILRHYGMFLQFITCHHIALGNIGAALTTLDQLCALLPPVSPEVEALRALLAKRLEHPSHEKAFALLAPDPDAAQEVWQTLLAQYPEDHVALHHLACLTWSRAYDEVLAQRYEAALPFWQDGLEYYRQLYGRAAYWEELRQKGHALGQTTAHPFNEDAFEAWRNDALYQLGRTLLDLIFHLMAGLLTASHGRDMHPRVQLAQSLMSSIQTSQLPFSTQERLGDELADHYLDPDPTNVSNFEISTGRARLVLDIDPANVKARCFLLRATTYRINVQKREGNQNHGSMVQQLHELQRHAVWLADRVANLPEERRVQVTSDLASYYHQMAEAKHSEGQDYVTRANEASVSAEQRRYMERVLQCYRESDSAYQQSLKFDPVNIAAKKWMEFHQEQIKAIESQLRGR